MGMNPVRDSKFKGGDHPVSIGKMSMENLNKLKKALMG